jgi:hypothetical protein
VRKKMTHSLRCVWADVCDFGFREERVSVCVRKRAREKARYVSTFIPVAEGNHKAFQSCVEAGG